jgi:hypothetical protein
MWMYKHWRYRPEAAEPGAYPFYANVSPHFEKRLSESEAKIGHEGAQEKTAEY